MTLIGYTPAMTLEFWVHVVYDLHWYIPDWTFNWLNNSTKYIIVKNVMANMKLQTHRHNTTVRYMYKSTFVTDYMRKYL